MLRVQKNLIHAETPVDWNYSNKCSSRPSFFADNNRQVLYAQMMGMSAILRRYAQQQMKPSWSQVAVFARSDILTLAQQGLRHCPCERMSSRSSLKGRKGRSGGVTTSKLSSVIKPSTLPSQKLSATDEQVGLDFAGPLNTSDIISTLNEFFRRPAVISLALQQGLEHTIFQNVFSDFRKYCVKADPLPAELHIMLSDIIQGQGTVVDLFPFFLQHAKVMYPHLDCVDDLRYVSDLRHPANWFPLARAKQRKIVIHAGPTNSGKTYHAFQRYLEAKSAIYCGPLKMLAVEIFNKSNAAGVDCDLVTGEERKMADPDGKREAEHVACTVEMTDIERDIDVAVIDEIQMLRDTQRGWAWLRAFLGVNANEVHLCGEETAIDLIENLALDTGDTVEIRRYQRLTPIEYMNQAVGDMTSVEEGDCIVCFSKSHIYYVCRELEKLGKQCAVIYGSLPPGTKMAQAARFNDPADPCKILVATDAIGMGLNLNIRRVVFYTLTKRSEEDGAKKSIVIPASQALQIAGRCGRYGTTHKDKGYVTTFNAEDLEMMHELLQQPLQPIARAGIHPTADQMELFGYYLPNATLSDLIDIFITVMTIDNDKYFLCHMDQFKKIAEVIEHVPIPLRSRYIFCCAPIPLQSAFVTTTLLKFVRRFSVGQPLTIQWLKEQIEWPLKKPLSVNDLTHLEAVHDTLDLYNWLSYRFEDQFPDRELVRELQTALDEEILSGVTQITYLFNSTTDSPKTSTQSKKMDQTDIQVKRLLRKLKRNRKSDER